VVYVKQKSSAGKILAIVALVLLLGIGGCTALIVVGANEAADDLEEAEQEALESTSCEVTGVDALGDYAVEVTVENTSSKRSDFFVEFVLRDEDEARLGESGFATISNLEPDESTTEEAFSIVDSELPPEDVVCDLVDVTRTASL
jgi:hypothetical protein